MSTQPSYFDDQMETLQEYILLLEHYTSQFSPVSTSEAVFEKLHAILEELHTADEELRQQHEELTLTHEQVNFERQRYQELFNLAPDPYIITDTQGSIREANWAAAMLLHRSQDSLLGKPLTIFVRHEERRAFYTHLLQQRLNPRKASWEATLQPPKAPSLAVEVTVAPVYDAMGVLHGMRWLFHDISERKKTEEALQAERNNLEDRIIERTNYLRQINEQLLAEIIERRQTERALRESEQRFRAVFDQAALGIAILSPAGTWQQANQRFCDLLGYRSEELYQQPWQQTTHPDDIAAEEEYLRRLVTNELASYSREKRYIDKQGREFWGNLTISTIRDVQGCVLSFINILEDISMRKVTEEQTRQAEQALLTSQEQLRQLAAHIQRSQEQERTRIARELHDDLGQLLTGLQFDIDWLSNQFVTEPASYQERVQIMQQQISALKNTVHRIGTELRPTMLDDLGLFDAVEWQLQHTCHRRGLASMLHLPEKDISLPKELATALFRIFQEALTNVARHAEASVVIVRLIPNATSLLLEVIDNGKGITAEQASNPRSLGLLGMRERAALWNGEVRIESTAGQGTTVQVYIAYPIVIGDKDDSYLDC